MKKLSVILLTAIVASPLILNFLPPAAAETNISSSAVQSVPQTDASAQPVTINGEDIKFQYISTVFNGKEQKPAVTVKSGDSILTANTDFIVTYPKDCVNAGKKTVIIEGIGNYKGRFSATYMIEPLDCSDESSAVNITVAPCFYSGKPLTPEVNITANGISLESGDYTLAFYDNTNVTSDEEKAKCRITFRGNYSGSRTVEFDIAKTRSEDLDIQLMVHNGDRITYDLSRLKPDGAQFGAVKYYIWDYIPEHLPKIAFNELIFTVPMSLSGGTAVIVPVINAPNREDYNIVVYPTTTEKVIPKTVVKPVKHKYDGKPVSADVFSENGSYATAEGKQIEGTWEFWTDPPVLPCENVPCIVTFTPSDPRYTPVDDVVFVTITEQKAEKFKIKPHRSEISVWQTGQLVISGIPEDYKGIVTFTCDCDNRDEFEIIEVSSGDPTQREYEVNFFVKSGRYTFTATLSGDSIYEGASSQCSIMVGNYVPPEDKPADKTTTPEELAALVNSAAEESTVKAEGIRSISADTVRAAFDKRLTLEVKINENYTWIADTTKLSNSGALDLDISAAVIPASLLNKIGGENTLSFNVYANNLGSGTKLRVSAADKKNMYANLFLYAATGELKFVSCAPVKSDGTADLNISAAGKYAVIIDSETKLSGDLDNNCKISIADVRLLLQELLFLPPPLSIEGRYVKRDVDGNGKFTISDVSKLLGILIFSV